MPYLPPDFTPVHQSYSIYGKTVRSNFPMPLPPANGVPADINVVFEGIVPKTEDRPPNSEGRIWQREKNHRLLRFYNHSGHMNQFLFRHGGSHIRVTQSWPEWRDTLFVLMNSVLATAVSLQDGPILHASSLVRNGKSTLVMGISGAGKSTLSAALAVNGMSLHSDDIAVLAWNGRQIPSVMAGYPRIKIDSGLPKWMGLPDLPLIKVFVDPADLINTSTLAGEPLPFPEPEKWLLADNLPGGFHSDPALLNTIIILGERDHNITKPRIETLTAASAGMALTEHIYGRDWLNLPGIESLTLCTKLAQSVPVYRVNMPDDLENLLRSAEIIEEQIVSGNRS